MRNFGGVKRQGVSMLPEMRQRYVSVSLTSLYMCQFEKSNEPSYKNPISYFLYSISSIFMFSLFLILIPNLAFTFDVDFILFEL